MKKNRFQIPVTLAAVGAGLAGAHELTFLVNCPPDAVAVQFDVTSSGTSSFGTPTFQGASPHTVESAVLASTRATRFVVYSTTGLAISVTGEIMMTFSSDSLADGMLSVSDIKASDASGGLLSASPNSLPVVIPGPDSYRSQQVGVPTTLSATAYDLDGFLASLRFSEGGVEFSTVFSYEPGTVTWTPTTSGTPELTATATDGNGAETIVSLGEIRAYELSDLATFGDFESIHFGPAADPANLGFETAAFGSGIPNGLAWVLGINPNAPDFSLLPWATTEDGVSGAEFVFRFNRLASLPGLSWSVLESTSLAGGTWGPVPGGSLTETPVGDGTVDVEVRKTIDPETEPKVFMSLEATEAP